MTRSFGFGAAGVVSVCFAVASISCSGGGDGSSPPLPPPMTTNAASGQAVDGLASWPGHDGQCAPMSFSRTVKKAKDMVVTIFTSQDVGGGGASLGFPFDLNTAPVPKKKVRQGLGTGFVIDAKEGLIVTNNHVIEGASEILVQLADRREFPAGVVGRDRLIDLAILRIPEPAPAQAVLGDPDSLQVGDWLVAIGNPLGLANTVTVGVVSALGRSSWDMKGEIPGYADFIQTDASINPGNSGGPLLDVEGRVVGINTAIVQGGQGIGFAIPVSMLLDVKDQLIENGRISRSWMGVLISPVDDAVAKNLGMSSPRGALIGEIVPGGPAAESGFQPGDVILEFGGKVIDDGGRLPWIIARTPSGEAVNVKILRDGSEETRSVILMPMPES